jgi:hypothetical protein
MQSPSWKAYCMPAQKKACLLLRRQAPILLISDHGSRYLMAADYRSLTKYPVLSLLMKQYFWFQKGIYIIKDRTGLSVSITALKHLSVSDFYRLKEKSLITGVGNNQFVSKIIITEQNLNVTEGGAGCINLVIDGIEDETGRIWYADQWRGIRYTENYYSGCKVLEFNSPWSNTAGQITFSGELAMFASGGINEDYGYANSTSGFYLFEKNQWTNYNGTNLPVMDEKQLFNVQAIQQNPVTKDLYIGSYWNGLIRFNPESNTVEHFNKDNSVLRGAAGDESRTRISHLLFDDRQNLWISNFLSPRPLVLKTKDNEWYSFALPGNNQTGSIAIDRAGNKWVPLVTTGGSIVVFNENGTPAVSTDDKVRLINRNNSEISSNRVNCVAVDADGLVWVGTSSGPVVFDVGCADPFSESCRGSIRRVVVDGIPRPSAQG